MNIHEEDNDSPYRIQRYDGGLWVNDKRYTQSIAIRGHQLISPWHAGPVSALTVSDFQIFESTPQTIIIGTGDQLVIPEAKLLEAFFAKGIGVEFMDSRRAAYTYTVLSSELRDVGVFILIDAAS